ncbi:hypothetical protein QEN19_003548 [Hanseniaspora menglaensis]
MFKPGFKSLQKVVLGNKFTNDYKIYYKNTQTGRIGSFFHDIPLKDETSKLFNMVVEIPQFTNAKYEVSKTDILNPIVQDTKKGKLRFINNVFPYKGYICSYGSIPQTWEDPELGGDNDPLDVLDISTERNLETGDIQQVKVLGSLGLIDDGEIDYKIISISDKSLDFYKINNLKDVETFYPGLLSGIKFWFANYKVKNEFKNEFLNNGEYSDVDETLDIIKECHLSWKTLIAKKTSELNIKDPLNNRECQIDETFTKLLQKKIHDQRESLATNLKTESRDYEIDGYDSKWYFR